MLTTIAMDRLHSRGRVVGLLVNGNETSHGLTVTGNDDRLAALNVTEQRAATRPGLVSPNGSHVCLPRGRVAD